VSGKGRWVCVIILEADWEGGWGFTICELLFEREVELRDGGSDDYVIDANTNRYVSIDSASPAYDAAGNLQTDKDGYKYHYDYENRIVKISKEPNETPVAHFAYDGLGRRIRKIDSVANQTTLYYYNNNWQVVAETDANGLTQRWFVYGNYIDEALMMAAKCLDSSDPGSAFAHTLYYVQDGLYSTRALVSTANFVISEQSAYDVYGRPVTWTSGDADADRDIDATDQGLFTTSLFKSECDPNYNWRCDIDNSGAVNFGDMGAFQTGRFSSTPANQQSFFTNPYYFTGRRIDLLDDGSLTLQYNRHRYYDYYTGRWTTQDPLGYVDGMNLYEYVQSNPLRYSDWYALWGSDVHRTGTIRWAKQVGYRQGRCAEILGTACNDVDSIKGGKGPYPVGGDFRYHFDTDKKGNNFLSGARDGRITHHKNLAVGMVGSSDVPYDDVKKALKELGTALHPLQDKYSHNKAHGANSPLWHAPKWWCWWKSGMSSDYKFSWHPWHSTCMWHKSNNPNWDDPHRPDRVSQWHSDHVATRKATENELEAFLKYPCVCARCKYGFRW